MLVHVSIDPHLLTAAGLQAIMPETVMLALATQCPGTTAEVVKCAQRALDGTDSPIAIADEDASTDVHRAVPLQLQQQAAHVSLQSVLTRNAMATKRTRFKNNNINGVVS